MGRALPDATVNEAFQHSQDGLAAHKKYADMLWRTQLRDATGTYTAFISCLEYLLANDKVKRPSRLGSIALLYELRHLGTLHGSLVGNTTMPNRLAVSMRIASCASWGQLLRNSLRVQAMTS